ncbi:ANKFY1 [Cordylochernes scorpioides]|uniref:ANKFY1 n=1 Tax=Cordylochernes scorpioides TaxID=51811 RepID=A0ABY6JZ98_9ARAC|nr:ANKFY1 [Cordylochernes scorpioides]
MMMMMCVCSDLIIHLDGTSLRAHKFVLEARSSKWGVLSLPEVDSLDLTGDFPLLPSWWLVCSNSTVLVERTKAVDVLLPDVPQEIGSLLFKWVYTDKLPPSLPDSTLLRLMALGRRFSLSHLISR